MRISKWILIITIHVSIQLLPGSGFAQVWEWTRYGMVGSSGNARGITIDKDDNVYVSGSFSHSFEIPGDTLIRFGSYEGYYFIKYDQSGNRQWIKSDGNGSYVCIERLKTDPEGNVYFIGNPGWYGLYFNDTILFLDPFVAKLDPSGQFCWGQPIPAFSSQTDLLVDITGNVYVAFRTNSDCSDYFGDIEVINDNSNRDIGVGKFDANGDAVWVELLDGPLWGTNQYEWMQRIGMDFTPTGDLVLGGTLDNKAMATIVKADNGAIIKQFMPASGNAYATGVTSDENNNYIITGMFMEPVNFGQTTLTPIGYEDMFIVSYDLQGNENWVQHIYGLRDESRYHLPNDIGSDRYGNSYTCGKFFDDAVFGTDTIECWSDESSPFLVKFRYDGTYCWTEEMGGEVNSNNAMDIEVEPDGRLAITGIFSGPGIFGPQTITDCAWYNVFFSRIKGSKFQISGNVYSDLNNNGIKDYSEPNETGMEMYRTPGNDFKMTNQQGNYHFEAGANDYLVRPSFCPKYNIFTPESYSIPLNDSNPGGIHYDFGHYIIPEVTDLDINLTNIFEPQFGMPFDLVIDYESTGTNIISGTVRLKLDTLIQVIDIDIQPTYQSPDLIIWQYNNLSQYQQGQINLNCLLSSNIFSDTTIELSAEITPILTDTVPTDNVDTLRFTLEGITESNNITVAPQGNVSQEFITQQQPFTYLVKFRNIFPDTIHNLVIEDSVSGFLDITTLQVINSSHEYTITKSSGQLLIFNFNNINLPDVMTNDHDCNGFIQFQISPFSNLQHGDLIKNTARIFFDSVSTILTNTTSNMVVFGSENVEENPAQFLALKVFPNPAHKTIFYECELKEADGITVSIYNPEGLLVFSRGPSERSQKIAGLIHSEGFRPGIYVLEMKGTKSFANIKIIIN